jgi:fibronectin type 3 domain-containing protein
MKHGLILFFILFLSIFDIAAQQKPGVKLLAKVKGKSIMLRWAPTSSSVWMQGNQKGYRIERFTIAREKEILKGPKKLQLTSTPLKPRPVEQWKADAEVNKYSAIAAQAIYGSSFQVSMPQSNNLAEIANRSSEQEQRYSFALLAADHSFQTAKLSGLAFNDTTAKNGERYLYRVYVALQDAKLKFDTGNYYLGLQDSVGLTPPMHVTAQFADKIVLLKWPKSFAERQYTSFIIERSDEKDGRFVRRNNLPYLNTTSEGANELFFQALDSLPQNGVEYQYRIRGVTPFGEIGPESERVSGKGFQTLDAKASIIEAREELGRVTIQWKILGNQNAIDGIYIERASNTDQPFVVLNPQKLNRESTSYIDASPLSSNYYRVKTVGEHGQHSTSFPFFIQLIDSIPPAQPQGLKAVVDTTGIAKLSWTANREKDLLGYRLYRSNFLNAEFSQINPSVFPGNAYSDSLNIKTLSTKIYYKLAAFDKRLNRSVFSQVVEVELPDVIPPQPPMIKEIRPDSTGILLVWNRSSSDDVSSYQLQRKAADSTRWKTTKVFNNKDSAFYLDLKVDKKRSYQYRVIAIDKRGLKSIPSNTVSGKALVNTMMPPVKNLTAQVDRDKKTITLHWKYDERGVSKYLVYRAMNDELITLYRTVPGGSLSFEDVNVKMDTKYKYRIKCVFNDSSVSGFSSDSSVKF